MSEPLTARPVSFSRVSLAVVAGATHANLLGNVHGGEIMKLADSTAGATAYRHSGRPAVTAAMDEMTFLAPVHVGDIVKTYAEVNWAGRSCAVPGLIAETPTEVRRLREAEIRRAHRLARKMEIDQGRD